MKVAEIREQGYRVYVKHRRRCVMYDIGGKPTEHFLKIEECPKECSITKGGYTFVEIVKGDKSFKATSQCSVKDNFNKKVGLTVALGRAYKLANENELEEYFVS